MGKAQSFEPFVRVTRQKVFASKNMNSKHSGNQPDISNMLLKPLYYLENRSKPPIFEAINRSVTYVKRYCPH